MNSGLGMDEPRASSTRWAACRQLSDLCLHRPCLTTRQTVRAPPASIARRAEAVGEAASTRLTGSTSFPIPSAGIMPSLRVCRIAAAILTSVDEVCGDGTRCSR